jgi:hypothetical protein
MNQTHMNWFITIIAGSLVLTFAVLWWLDRKRK